MSDERRSLKFQSEDDAIAEVERLRESGYKQLKNWSLPMICWHLGTRGQTFAPPASLQPTPEQAERKKLLDTILKLGGPPPGFEAPPQITPDPAKVNAGDVDKLIETFRDLKTYKHDFVDFGGFGPVKTDDVRKLMLGHAAHHLSFLLPAKRRTNLIFKNEDEAIAEVERLRTNGYVQHGTWNLPQILWHLQLPIDQFFAPAADDAQPNDDQRAMQERFVDVVFNTGKFPPNARYAPPQWQPPANASDGEIAKFIAGMRKLKSYTNAKAMLGPMGPVPTEKARKLFLTHASHHLSFLEPKRARPALRYQNEDDVIADVERLRLGHTKTGNWSFAQACWHLTAALKSRMNPAPVVPDTAEQIARRPMVAATLKSGTLPSGLPAPEAFQPPANATDAAIDELIATLKQFRDYRGRIAMHRLFGQLPDDQARQLNIIHIAHHLSQFAPNSNAPAGAASI